MTDDTSVNRHQPPAKEAPASFIVRYSHRPRRYQYYVTLLMFVCLAWMQIRGNLSMSRQMSSELFRPINTAEVAAGASGVVVRGEPATIVSNRTLNRHHHQQHHYSSSSHASIVAENTTTPSLRNNNHSKNYTNDVLPINTSNKDDTSRANSSRKTSTSTTDVHNDTHAQPSSLHNHSNVVLYNNCTLTNGQETSFLHGVPSFIIVGTQKGGTSALGTLLEKHPLLLRSRKFEAHFFDFFWAHDFYYAHGVATEAGDLSLRKLCYLRSKYAGYFKEGKVRQDPRIQTYEKTPSYMMIPKVAERIRTVTPWAKIIVTLRNPVDRAFSNYKMNMNRNELPKNKTFAEHFAEHVDIVRNNNCLPPISTANHDHANSSSASSASSCHHSQWALSNCVYRGFYAQQLERFYQQGYRTDGDNRNMFVFPYERFKREPAVVFDDIMDFLGVPRHAYESHHLNKTYLPVEQRHTLVLDAETRKLAHEFYKPYNDQLADLLGEEWRGIWD